MSTFESGWDIVTSPSASVRKTQTLQGEKPAEQKPGVPGDSEGSFAPLYTLANIEKLGQQKSNQHLLRWMFGFLSPVKPLVFMACFYLAAVVGLEQLALLQTGKTVDTISRFRTQGAVPHFWSWLWSGGGHPLSVDSVARSVFHHESGLPLRDLLLVLVIITGLMLLMRYLRTVAESKLSMTLVFYIREAVYDKLQRVGFGFHDAISTGQLINRALTDLNNVRAFVQSGLLLGLEIVLVVGGYIIVICLLSPWLALLSLVPLPIWTWYIMRFSKKIQPANQLVMESSDKDISIITENIAGVHVVKAFATEGQEIRKYNANADTYYDRVMKRIVMFADFTPVVRVIATASHLSLFWCVGVLVIKGRLNAGDFLILGSAMGAILARLQQVATINEQYQNAIVSARRLYEVLAAPPTVPEKPDARSLPPGTGAVKFEHVTFGYSGVKPVLQDISFEVKGGSIVAIVGPTGAGKSTMMSMIARFYDPQSGRILIDGMDVRDTTLASLRTQISVVFQETYLFSDTVGANIAYGRPGITHGEIEAAARLAQAHEFIEMMPRGYETVLSERGSSLSGGQRQRLAIARAILTNPRVLILDDATAAVDPETEDMIRRAMRFVMKGRTTFVIAHRISTVKQADLVLVIENGRFSQSGTHDQLMEQDGHYRDIAAVQLYGDDEYRPDPAEAPSHMDRVQDPRQFVPPPVAAGPTPAPRVDDTREGE